MKTRCFSLWFALAVGASPLSAFSATLAPTPSPTASPLPATEPEAAGGKDSARAPAARQAEAEKAAVDLETKWCEAEARHDAAFLEKVEAEDFTFTDSTGKLTTKKDEIEEARQGGDKIEFKLSDMKAHVYGDTVILTGQTTFNPNDTESAPNAYRWTDVFVRQPNGEWQVVASQATTLAPSGIDGGSPGN